MAGNGMEMMLGALLRSAGIDMQEFKSVAEAMVKEAQQKLSNLETSLQSIDYTLTLMDQRLLRLELAILQKEKDYPSYTVTTQFFEADPALYEQFRKDFIDGKSDNLAFGEKEPGEIPGDGNGNGSPG